MYPVNPTSVSVAGVRAYPSILDIPDTIDVALVVVPADAVPAIVDDCAKKGVHGVVIISAGFAEVGSSGREAEQAIVATARRNGMRVIGPNCLGIVNTSPDVQMNATFAPVVPVRGPVAFLSQSGGLGIELMSRTGELGIGISEFVSVGNKADVSGNDLLQHWETDPNTDVILFYLESFGNPRKFARLARRIARRKAIVAVKGGRTQAGSRAASSHTAALASPDVAVDALFRQAGVIRVDTLEQLLDTAQVLAHQPLPPGRRVAIIGNAGGPGILAADACAGAGLDVPELTAETQAALRAFVAVDASVRNPIDLVASATAEQYERALRVVLADPEVDAVLAMFVPPLVTEAADVAHAIARAAGDAGAKPVVACFLGRAGVPDALRGGSDSRTVPSFAFPEAAAHALARAAELADWRRRPTGTVPGFHDIDEAAARRLVDEHLIGHRGEGPPVPMACGWTPPRRRRCSAASASRCSRLGSCTPPTKPRPRRRSSAIPSRSRRVRPSSCTRPTSAGSRCACPTPPRCAPRTRRWRIASAPTWAAASCSGWPRPASRRSSA